MRCIFHTSQPELICLWTRTSLQHNARCVWRWKNKMTCQQNCNVSNYQCNITTRCYRMKVEHNRVKCWIPWRNNNWKQVRLALEKSFSSHQMKHSILLVKLSQNAEMLKKLMLRTPVFSFLLVFTGSCSKRFNSICSYSFTAEVYQKLSLAENP